MKKNIHITVAILLTCLCISGQDQKEKKQISQVKKPEQMMSPKEIKLLIDSISNALNRWYIYPDKAALMVNILQTNCKNGIYNKIENRTALAYQIRADLREAHKDYCLNFIYYPEDAKLFERSPEEKSKDVEKHRKIGREYNFGLVKAEILPGNVGYLRWDHFYSAPLMDESKPIFKGAFQFVKNCKALVIDMRHNQGGYHEMVLFTQSHFFNQKTQMNYIINRNKDSIKRWTDPDEADPKLNMPVYVLTFAYTFGSAEDFTYGLQKAKRATIVGETTDGSAHLGQPYSMGQGFAMNIPYLRAYSNISKSNWEGTGVVPDVMVPSEQALLKAQELIYNDLIAKTNNEKEKQKLQWLLIYTKNKAELDKQFQTEPIKIANEVLLNYCGEYSSPNQKKRSIHILQKGNYLYKHMSSPVLVGDNPNAGDDIRLIAVSPTKFIYDDNSARSLEFAVSPDGVVNMVLTHMEGVFTLNKKK